MSDYTRQVFSNSKSFVIPLGSDPELFAPAKRDEDIYPQVRDQFKVLWVGSPQYPWQGVRLILDVAERMLAVDPSVVFILIGKRLNFEQFRDGTNTLSNVHVIDEKPYLDIPRYIASADVGLCLYKHQRLDDVFYRSPLKLFDYMASGIPVIATAAGQIKQIINHMDNGVIVNNGVDEIVSQIRLLKEHRFTAQQLAQKARMSIEKFYNWERVAIDTERVMRDLL